MQKEIPQDLHEMLKQQRDACEAMIEEKNKLIGEFEHVRIITFRPAGLQYKYLHHLNIKPLSIFVGAEA